MKLKTIEFDSSKQSKSDIFKYMIADTKNFVDWAKDYNKVDDLLHQNIIVALNNLKNVSKEELESLDECELNEYFGIVNNVENILYKYITNVCENVKDDIREIIDKRTKSSYKPTKEDLNKLRKEDLINMIINEEEPKKNQN